MEIETIPPIKPAFRDQDYSLRETLRQLLVEGREGQLCDWLKEVGFIPQTVRCENAECNGAAMLWKKARIIDKYHWVCPLCKKKATIRHGTFLESVQCTVRSAVGAIMGWCDGMPPEEFTQDDGKVKASVVKKIYSMCSLVTDWYMQRHPEISLLGGEGDDYPLIVDMFPHGCMTTTPHNNNYSKQVLCVADTRFLPARIWVQLLDVAEAKDYSKVIPLLLNHIRPRSTLVVSPLLFPELSAVTDMKEVISIEALTTLNEEDYQRSLKNLETIWESTVSVCQEIQDMSNAEGSQLLRELQWRTIFNPRIKTIFAHIVEYQAHARN
ncbi:uncharacterized protein LOC111043417 isoform X2 [Nilaparvata lugens]|uniref:uncharacterized protein LOC111043417 isoform X1 n=1 Tax=Nilaparvata lugens TaxID=108931 RepID=UPI00193D1E8B|nr:uncharacterized protein LOC111043417 isoform X1 [Nilaparvata lugens]XP_039292609.1 uncharacterized protein LOC111043417 isoform X2 [Nilaparvata lugens]